MSGPFATILRKAMLPYNIAEEHEAEWKRPVVRERPKAMVREGGRWRERTEAEETAARESFHRTVAPQGKGWEPIPGTKHGGYRRRGAGGKWEHWYPEGQNLPGLKEHGLDVRGSEASRGVREALERHVGQAADLCKVAPPLCRGNLGIPREQMPQFQSEEVLQKFLAHMQSMGHPSRKTKKAVGVLQPIQKEINADKVHGMLQKLKDPEYRDWIEKTPVVVSSDGHVIDGHHRWATLLADNPGNEVPVWEINAPARKIVDHANRFAGVEQHGFGQSAKKGITFDFDTLWKGKTAQVGEVRTWSGIDMRKVAPGQWVPANTHVHVPEDHDRHFERHPGAEAVPMAKLLPGKVTPAAHVEAAKSKMRDAVGGKASPRTPIEAVRRSDGHFEITSGHATAEAVRHFGWESVPVRVTGEKDVRTGIVSPGEMRETAQKFGVDLDEHETGMLVPKESGKIHQAWDRLRSEVAKRLGVSSSSEEENRALDAASNDHAHTPEDLNALAKSAEPEWTQTLHAIASEIGGGVEASLGPGDCCAVKGLSSLRNKIGRILAKTPGLSEREAVRFGVYDALRGTIMADSVGALGKAVHAAKARFEAMGAKMTIENKWSEPNDSGYVGIHASVLFPTPSGETIKAELQFHPRQVFDGTMDCPKEQAHRLYDMLTGKAGASAPKADVLHASKLLFLSAMARAV